MGESHSRGGNQGIMTCNPPNSATVEKPSDRSSVSDHYARSGLIEAIGNGVIRMGKTIDTVTIDDLAAVDEFHIGGRRATQAITFSMSVADSVGRRDL
jgi:hypothetical protein